MSCIVIKMSISVTLFPSSLYKDEFSIGYSLHRFFTVSLLTLKEGTRGNQREHLLIYLILYFTSVSPSLNVTDHLKAKFPTKQFESEKLIRTVIHQN
jgi:hypothetical protein